MRRFFIDADTGSDDVVAIVMAMHEKDVRVEAIGCVAGNVPLDLAVKNAAIAVEWSGADYRPPLYAGMDRPLLVPVQRAFETHGSDGMGEMHLDTPDYPLSEGFAPDKLIEYSHKFAGTLEVVALGPLTNIAMAVRKDPTLHQRIKHLYIMGTAGFGPGNVNPVSEFNIWADPDACDIVLKSGIEQTYIGWDICCDDAMLFEDEIADIVANGSQCAKDCIRCNKTLMEMNKDRFGSNCLDMADPAAMAVALWPDIVIDAPKLFTYVVRQGHHGDNTFGQVIFTDRFELGDANATVIRTVNIKEMKKRMVKAMQ